MEIVALVCAFISLSHCGRRGGEGMYWVSWMALGQRQMGKDGLC